MLSKYTHAYTHTRTENNREDEEKAEAGCSLEAVFLTSATARPPCCAPPASYSCAAQCHPEHQQQLE